MSPSYLNNNPSRSSSYAEHQQDNSDYFRQKYTAVRQQLLHTQNLNARLTADLTYQQALVEDLSAQIALFKARGSETSKRVADEMDAFEKDRLSWYERESQLLQEVQRLQAKYEERMLRTSGALNEQHDARYRQQSEQQRVTFQSANTEPNMRSSGPISPTLQRLSSVSNRFACAKSPHYLESIHNDSTGAKPITISPISSSSSNNDTDADDRLKKGIFYPGSRGKSGPICALRKAVKRMSHFGNWKSSSSGTTSPSCSFMTYSASSPSADSSTSAWRKRRSECRSVVMV